MVCIPTISELSEQLQRVFKSHGVASYHKPFNTIKSLLVRPKDKSKIEKHVGWYTVSNVVNATRKTLVRPECWVPDSKNTQMENTPTLPSPNSHHPVVIAIHWMTPKS